MENKIKEIFSCLEGFPFSVHDEKRVQAEMEELFLEAKINHSREHQLKPNGIIDFMFDGIGVEVKVKGSVEAIYKQCVRYCEHDDVKALVLVTARSMGFPEEINGKPCYYFSLSRALL